MRIFALETNPRRIIERFCSQGEDSVLQTRYHWLSFLVASFDEFLAGVVVLAGIVFAVGEGWRIDPVVWIPIGLIYFVLFLRVFKAFVDWRYDFLFVTTDKIVLVDQTSIFRQEVKPIHLENVGGVSTATQFLGLFPFGILTLHLKEGLGGDTITRKYIPNAESVASRITDVVTKYQRTQMPPPQR